MFLTADQELSYQQNLHGRRIGVLVVSSNNWGVIRGNAAAIQAAIAASGPGCFRFLDIGHGRGE